MQEAMGRADTVSPFFLYRLHFSEVFERKGGFDIVVANPPYVRGELLGAQKDEFKVTPIYEGVYAGSADLYVYFYARGYHLLKQGGQLAYITSNKFIRAKYGTGLRGFLADKVDVRELIDFGELPVFKEAATFPLIVIGSKGNRDTTRFTQVTEWTDGMFMPDVIAAKGQILPANAMNGSDWQLANTSVAALIDKLKAAGVPLSEYVNGQIYRGVVTGFNEAFVIDGAKRAELLAADPKSAEIIKPLAVGDDIRKWRINQRDVWLIFTRRGIDIEQYPAVKAHLEKYQVRLTPGGKDGRKLGRYKWYEIQDDIAYYLEFEKHKIIYPDIAMTSRFTFDTAGTYFGNTVYMLPVDDLYLLGLLNSSVVWWIVKQQFACLGDPNNGGRFRFFTQSVDTLPIPTPPPDLRERIAAAAQACLDAAKDHPDRLPALEAELNALVYQAYGLDAEDIAVIEGTVGKTAHSAQGDGGDLNEDGA